MTSSYEKIEEIKAKIEASEQKAKRRLLIINITTTISIVLAMAYLGYLSNQVSKKKEELGVITLELDDRNQLLQQRTNELKDIENQLKENQDSSPLIQEIKKIVSDSLTGYTIKIRYTSEFQSAADDIFSTLNDQTTSTDVPPFIVQRAEIVPFTMSQWGATGFELRYNVGSEDKVAEKIQEIIKTNSAGKYDIRLQPSTTASPNFISIFLAQ
ncbi:MAG: hypothetical protein ACO3EZ_03495 [Prochlorotrichaceae cyanobacterium]